MIKPIKTFNILIIITTVLSLIFYNIYSLFINKTNHCAFDLNLLITGYMVLTFLSIITTVISFLWWKKEKSTYRYCLILAVICVFLNIFGIINVKLYNRYNIMMNYEIWCERGMPEKYR